VRGVGITNLAAQGVQEFCRRVGGRNAKLWVRSIRIAGREKEQGGFGQANRGKLSGTEKRDSQENR